MANEAMYGSMIELQFLNYIFKVNSFQVVILNGIIEDHFTTYKPHFKFIKSFWLHDFSLQKYSNQ